MNSGEVAEVLRAYYDAADAAHPGHRYLWQAGPADSVREVVTAKHLAWTDEEVKTFATILAHRSTASTIELMENILASEDAVQRVVRSMRPGYRSTLVMHTVTFGLGVTLITAAVIAGYQGRDLLTAAFGGVGLLTIVSVFLREPLRGIQRTISNLLQLHIIYSAYLKQMTYWKAYVRNSHIEVKVAVIEDIRVSTEQTLDFIEQYCQAGSESRPAMRWPVGH